ncbi:ABC transporter ATP-binding protein [Baaleninema sp.]|uniref:ABC transporter ATP-binding protein n=1 Tax=Baaleninema sp. TaxID=3101197 RepID=UPI003D054BDE
MASFRDIVQYFRPYWGTSTWSMVGTGLFETIDLAVPYAIGQILNVLSGESIDPLIQPLTLAVANLFGVAEGKSLELAVLVGIIFIIAVVRAPIQPWVSGWFHWAIALDSRRDNSREVIAQILNLPLDFYDENNPGRIAGRVAKGLANHTWTYPEIAGQLVPKLMRVLGIFIVIWFIEPWIAAVFALSFGGILWFSLRDLRSIIRQEAKIERYMENTESRTSEIITNIKTVKAFATEANELQRQKQRLDREHKVLINRIHRQYVILETWQKTIIQTSLFGILVLSLWATVSGNISLGHFITTFTIASYAYSELEPISVIAELFARRYTSMVRFHEFMKRPSGKDAASLIPEPPAENPYRFTGKLEFNNVTFGYNSDRPVLQDIDFLIEPYQTVALVGRSGSGKSTLVKLLFRYFDPDSGRILIDGEDIRHLDIARYRRRLAIVHQEVDIFNGTLLENLMYGNPQATWEQVQSACEIARVNEFIDELPDGFYTVVGERGVRLSGGQRQRIGIARALIVNPDVLVFDEATSSLDYESERSIQQAMKSIFGTRTTIVIAHRLSTVRDADKIIVLDNGRIAEIGSHAELLRGEGLYRRLHALSEAGELVN